VRYLCVHQGHRRLWLTTPTADMKYGLQQRDKNHWSWLAATVELRPLPFAAGVLEMVLIAACDSVALVLPNEFRPLFLYVQHGRM
jgi:hypothetical protein